MEKQRTGDVVRQVADDAQRGFVASICRNKRSKVEVERVARMHAYALTELARKACNQVAVEFDHMQMPEPLRERRRQRTQPRPDLDHQVVGARRDRADDRVDHAHVDEKILTKTFARHVACWTPVRFDALLM